MNNNQIEKRLSQASGFPDVPTKLRANVADVVEKRLRRSTLIDDLKLLSLAFGILLAVLATTWVSMNRTTDSLKQLTDSNWRSEIGDVARVTPHGFRETIDLSKLLNPSMANNQN